MKTALGVTIYVLLVADLTTALLVSLILASSGGGITSRDGTILVSVRTLTDSMLQLVLALLVRLTPLKTQLTAQDVSA